ncbi:BON domain-containing protein [Herbiconiux ginsengi]|uniref:Osmotically-inducible protein OsmY, contains BON domain n=1 Tax=Herbiconiux ginsengi TaxID=381665 RepID=A0A1H3SYN2_9MICO|nr:BON domain-containing protein [Herbiconiux ginsengi]SDZ42797.1 Osmotically-inducible protein OsmY, contains BON domain [Herbiconiux ginsengi]
MSLTVTPTRHDIAVQDAVGAELAWRPNVDARHVSVTVSDGIVLLTGTVSTLGERRAAVRAAQSVSGVVTVIDEIVVQPPGTTTLSDAELAKRVDAALRWHAAAIGQNIRAEVVHGRVLLTGMVEADWQRRSVERFVGSLEHVVGVTDEIVVTPRPCPPDLQDQVVSALRRQSGLDVGKISVNVHDGEVRLGGIVSTVAQRLTASRVAAAHPAVRAVRNNIRVIPDLI